MRHARIGVVCVVCALTVLALPAVSPAGEASAPECWSQWLTSVPPAGVAWQDATFGDAINWIRNRDAQGAPCTMNVVVDWASLEEVGIDRDTEFELILSDVPMVVILDLLLQQVGHEDALGYEATGNILRISTVDQLDSRMVVQTYDLSTLVVSVPDFTDGPQIDLTLAERTTSRNGGGGSVPGMQMTEGGDAANPDRAARLEQLMEAIRTTIDRETWQVNGGEGSMALAGTRLVVRQSAAIQEKIGILLARLSKN